MSWPTDGPFPRPTPQLSESIFDLFSMKGKVVAITGGAGGIGYAVGEAVAEAGGDVAIIYNSSKTAGEKAQSLVDRFGIRSKAYQLDVTSWEETEKVVDQIAKDFGRIDGFVANAGGGVPGSCIDLAVEDWHKTQAINFHSTFYAAKAVGKYFKAQGSGSFVATTSISATIANIPFDQPAYNSSKAGVVHFIKSIARDWRLFARATCVSPGFVDTPMGPSSDVVAEVNHQKAVLGRMANVKELKGTYLLLLSDASTYITGSEILVDGGYTLT
ncbi:hypothetical protein JCM10207_005641 [Rhodosporidiobolus poonsookiae]